MTQEELQTLLKNIDKHNKKHEALTAPLCSTLQLLVAQGLDGNILNSEPFIPYLRKIFGKYDDRKIKKENNHFHLPEFGGRKPRKGRKINWGLLAEIGDPEQSNSFSEEDYLDKLKGHFNAFEKWKSNAQITFDKIDKLYVAEIEELPSEKKFADFKYRFEKVIWKVLKGVKKLETPENFRESIDRLLYTNGSEVNPKKNTSGLTKKNENFITDKSYSIEKELDDSDIFYINLKIFFKPHLKQGCWDSFSEYMLRIWRSSAFLQKAGNNVKVPQLHVDDLEVLNTMLFLENDDINQLSIDFYKELARKQSSNETRATFDSATIPLKNWQPAEKQIEELEEIHVFSFPDSKFSLMHMMLNSEFTNNEASALIEFNKHTTLYIQRYDKKLDTHYPLDSCISMQITGKENYLTIREQKRVLSKENAVHLYTQAQLGRPVNVRVHNGKGNTKPFFANFGKGWRTDLKKGGEYVLGHRSRLVFFSKKGDLDVWLFSILFHCPKGAKND